MLTPSPSQAIIRVIVAISPGGFAVTADAADNVTAARSALQMIGRMRFMGIGRLVDRSRRFWPLSPLVAPERRKFNHPGWTGPHTSQFDSPGWLCLLGQIRLKLSKKSAPGPGSTPGNREAGVIVIFVPFAEHDAACDNMGMRARRLLNLLIALSVAVGLVSMPIALPVHAHSGSPAMASSDGMPAMAEDMPCCPHEQKSKDCQDCPLLGFCLIKSTQFGPMAGAVLLDRTSLRAVLPVIDDAIADGLERPPPDHPPRVLV